LITLAIAQAQLELWLNASTAAAGSQSYAIDVDGSRRELARVSAAEIRKNIDYWNGKVIELSRRSSGRSRSRYIVN
jgi:hypothetical protein